MYIEDYGFLSDSETAALVSREGSIDWLCMPRFDSPAFFAKLLGDSRNGFWQIAPLDAIIKTNRSYRGETLILDTEFETATGRVRLTDFMPLRDENADIVRIVEGLEGTVEMKMKMVIRFDYGKIVPWVRRQEDGSIVALAGADALILRSEVATRGEGKSTAAYFTISAGHSQSFVLTYFPSHKPLPQVTNPSASLKTTEIFWKDWSNKFPECSHREAVLRSLLVLKGLTYAPTGGIVAAATTSLPEQLGGERNWDYRYCWLRDAVLTLYSLLSAGYTEEAGAWCNWLLRAIAGSPSQMQTLYGAAGERLLIEHELPHLAGYENSRPVRIGNAAAEQFQLDIYGEVMAMIYHARCHGVQLDNNVWHLQTHLIKFVIQHWSEPDEGIWEIRGPRRHFVHSKVMAWVALDRAIKTCEKFQTKGDIQLWKPILMQIHEEVCERGFNKKLNSFTQSYDSEDLDASLLMIPISGFLPATDPRVRSTIEMIEKKLSFDGFVMRYASKDSQKVDGLKPGEGAFLPCSFWLVDCLNLIGRHEDAVELFEKLLTIRNDLGLLSEEYDFNNNRLIGNFPQAFSHIALINSAYNLEHNTNQLLSP